MPETTSLPFITFQSNEKYVASRQDVNFWWPYITHILEQHNLPGADKQSAVICGYNPTYPVFLIDDIVVKFFGHISHWKTAFSTESAAHEYLIKTNSIIAPRILAKGQLFPSTNITWPYLVSSKVEGKSWLDTSLNQENKTSIAKDIGEQLHKIHALPTDARLSHDHKWSNLNLRAAAEKSILPPHLTNQVEKFISKLDNFDRCFVNGDLVATHIFIEDGHLSGIIDWGDATVTDKHYELGKLMDTFDWDKRLLKTVLDASNWPVKKNFTQQALGLALYRQAVGLTQHNTFDVFYKLPHLIQLDSINTLDELADILFGI
jgi:hygromycin-B 7''-O-kinase